MKAKMIKVSAAVTADVLFILQAVGTNAVFFGGTIILRMLKVAER